MNSLIWSCGVPCHAISRRPDKACWFQNALMEMELTLALPQTHAVSERRKTETSSSLAKSCLSSEVAAARLCALLPKLTERTAAIMTQRTVPTSGSDPLAEAALETCREMSENF